MQSHFYFIKSNKNDYVSQKFLKFIKSLNQYQKLFAAQSYAKKNVEHFNFLELLQLTIAPSGHQFLKPDDFQHIFHNF